MWIDLTCLLVASSVSAMCNAPVIVRSLPSLIRDFWIDFRKILKIKMSAISISSTMGSYSHSLINCRIHFRNMEKMSLTLAQITIWAHVFPFFF